MTDGLEKSHPEGQRTESGAGALVRPEPRLAPSTIVGTAGAERDLLRSPASGAPCVHWRLRVFETVSPGMELVHEASSPEPLQLRWHAQPETPPRVVRVALAEACLAAQPTVYGHDTAEARAVAKHLGLVGVARVEEVLIRQGDRLEAEGILVDPEAFGAGPFRGGQGPAELIEATVRLETGLSLRPTLLSWALGAAAALVGTSAAAVALVKLCRVPVEVVRAPAEIGPVKVVRPRWP
jgi:hypothetical protein